MNNVWRPVLLLLVGYHVLMLAYDLWDLDPSIDPTYYLRAVTIAIYALLCFLAWKSGIAFGVAYCIFTAICMYLKMRYPPVVNLGLIGQAFYPINIVFSGVILLATISIKRKLLQK
jgi:hypothetical protein